MRFTRVTLFLIAFIIVLGFYQLARHFLAEVEPQTFQATEEMMVDCAHVLAEIGAKVDEDHARIPLLRQAFSNAHARKFDTRIFNHHKKSIGIHAYMTNAKGIVIFDSDHGKREGLDYRAKRDVSMTLENRYGARSTRDNESHSFTSILYVAAPIGDPKNPSGVLTVYKPQLDVMPLVNERRQIILTACGLIGSGILLLIAAVFLWLFRPIGRITAYAQAVERGERPAKPKIGIGREVNTLAHALDLMRDTLENRKYVERYVQTLTHEMKSPLAAIRGAAELLDENMPPDARRRFISNIRAETARSERLINRLLELSTIESRTQLDETIILDFRDIVSRAIDQAKPLAENAKVDLSVSIPESFAPIHGDPFILRAAITNLLENAIDFSPQGSTILVHLKVNSDHLQLSITDQGEGIPEYARKKVFERFYSLRHPSSGRKGTGLGLTLVREAAELHQSSIILEPAPVQGTIATWTQPLA